MSIGGVSFTGLERLSDLIRQRNENEVEITRIIGRPTGSLAWALECLVLGAKML